MATTPYMTLSMPTVSTTTGPAWASMVNIALTAIDSHTHAPGFGAPVPSSGLNINAPLAFNGYDATTLRSVRLASQGAPLSAVTDIACLYSAGGALYFNNAAGQQIQITAGAALNASSLGAIGGDYSTSGASEVYIAASQTFQFFQAANKYANLDAGNVILREPGATSPQGVTLKSPTALAASYALKFPAALPAAASFLTLDASGNVASGAAVAGGITSSMVGTLARSNLPAVGQQISGSSGTFSSNSTGWVQPPNLSVSLTTTGRPVLACLQPDGDTGTYSNAALQLGSGGGNLFVGLFRDGTLIRQASFGLSAYISAAPSGFIFLDTGAAAGPHTYTMQVKTDMGTSTFYVYRVVLAVFEL